MKGSIVGNSKMKVIKSKTKKKMTPAQDAAYDRKHGIKAGSKADKAMDRKNGVVMKSGSKKLSSLSGHNSSKQNGNSESKLKKKNWIAGAIKKPGALHAEMGVKKGTKIPAGKLAAAAKSGGKLGQRARLAETLEGMHKKKSGKGMTSGSKAYLKRVGGKMGGNC